MSTVEQVRDSATPDESCRIEDAAWAFARENAACAAWRDVMAGESIALATHRLIGREFGKVLDMDFERFADLTGFELGFEQPIVA